MLNQRSIAPPGWPACRNAWTTSSPTSPQQTPRQGPIAATRSCGSDPNSRVIAQTPARAALCTVPRHPACTAPTARLRGSAMRTGAQSAMRTAITRSGSSVRMMSASGGLHSASRPLATATPSRCTCLTSRITDESAPSAAATACHSAGLPRSVRWCAVNRWRATAPSGRHSRAGPTPAAACVHANATLG